jgi:hypothetical protein
MTEAILTRAQQRYSEGREIVAEEVKLRQKSSRHIVRLASILRDLYEAFLQREDPHERLVLLSKRKGFADFRECMLELLRPLDLGERMGWYYVSIGRHLLGRIPEAELVDMPFEKVKQLARVAKAKTELPAELIERAKDTEEPAAKLREDVDVMLYGGRPDHSDGPKASLVLVGGQKLIRAIKQMIERLRPAVTAIQGYDATDAEVIESALADCLAGIQEAEDHEKGQLQYGRSQSRHDSQT